MLRLPFSQQQHSADELTATARTREPAERGVLGSCCFEVFPFLAVLKATREIEREKAVGANVTKTRTLSMPGLLPMSSSSSGNRTRKREVYSSLYQSKIPTGGI